MRSVLRFLVMLVVLSLLAGCGESSAEFCELAKTSTEPRTQGQVDEYYKQLETLAPSEIKNDVAILSKNWDSVNLPLEGGSPSHPQEVTTAAKNLYGFVGKECGTEGGVYLIFPEIGW